MDFKNGSKLDLNKPEVKQEGKNVDCNIELKNRKRLVMSGVVEFISSSESEIRVKTALGNLQILGSMLKPEKLSLTETELVVNGEINSVCFYGANNSKGLFKRLFK